MIKFLTEPGVCGKAQASNCCSSRSPLRDIANSSFAKAAPRVSAKSATNLKAIFLSSAQFKRAYSESTKSKLLFSKITKVSICLSRKFCFFLKRQNLSTCDELYNLSHYMKLEQVAMQCLKQFHWF
mmetsp:Transcript_19700/g.25521  ORF Transcript_19700/g.25521 Transcript_19700/m.25521 type:complete len:126 (+) Transcript_19700:911-1288(+)